MLNPKFFSFQAWVGHPYYDVIDNTTDFEQKLVRMISVIYYYFTSMVTKISQGVY